jgi:hypothetical protein
VIHICPNERCNASIFELANIEIITLQLHKYNFYNGICIYIFLFLGPRNNLHNTIELTEIPRGDILFNENRNMVSLQHMEVHTIPRCIQYMPQVYQIYATLN